MNFIKVGLMGLVLLFFSGSSWAGKKEYYSVDCAFPYSVVLKKRLDQKWELCLHIICQDSMSTPRVFFGFPSRVTIKDEPRSISGHLRSISGHLRIEATTFNIVLGSTDFTMVPVSKKLKDMTWDTHNYCVRIPYQTLKTFVQSFGASLLFQQEYGMLKVLNYAETLNHPEVPILGAFSTKEVREHFEAIAKKALGQSLLVEVSIDQEVFIRGLVQLMDYYLTLFLKLSPEIPLTENKQLLQQVLFSVEGKDRPITYCDFKSLILFFPKDIQDCINGNSARQVTEEEKSEWILDFHLILKSFTLRLFKNEEDESSDYTLILGYPVHDLAESTYRFGPDKKPTVYQGPEGVLNQSEMTCMDVVLKVLISF